MPRVQMPTRYWCRLLSKMLISFIDFFTLIVFKRSFMFLFSNWKWKRKIFFNLKAIEVVDASPWSFAVSIHRQLSHERPTFHNLFCIIVEKLKSSNEAFNNFKWKWKKKLVLYFRGGKKRREKLENYFNKAKNEKQSAKLNSNGLLLC